MEKSLTNRNFLWVGQTPSEEEDCSFIKIHMLHPIWLMVDAAHTIVGVGTASQASINWASKNYLGLNTDEAIVESLIRLHKCDVVGGPGFLYAEDIDQASCG